MRRPSLVVVAGVLSLAAGRSDAAMPARGAPATTPARPPSHATPSHGATLNITVNPSGTVSVDGGAEMESPVVALHVAPGRHTVRVTNHAHTASRVARITVRPGERFGLSIDLE